jgi:hypothetical protein
MVYSLCGKMRFYFSFYILLESVCSEYLHKIFKRSENKCFIYKPVTQNLGKYYIYKFRVIKSPWFLSSDDFSQL